MGKVYAAFLKMSLSCRNTWQFSQTELVSLLERNQILFLFVCLLGFGFFGFGVGFKFEGGVWAGIPGSNSTNFSRGKVFQAQILM